MRENAEERERRMTTLRLVKKGTMKPLASAGSISMRGPIRTMPWNCRVGSWMTVLRGVLEKRVPHL